MHSPKHSTRELRIERQLVTLLITDIIAAGYAIAVDDGGDEVYKATTNLATVLDRVLNTDEDVLYLQKDGEPQGCITLVYGNEPGVTISDFSNRLAGLPFMEKYNERAKQAADCARRNTLVAWMIEEPAAKADRELHERLTSDYDGNSDENEEGDDDSCECSVCDATVDREDPYFATPCGTFCAEHMREHVKGCGICAGEFPELVDNDDEGED